MWCEQATNLEILLLNEKLIDCIIDCCQVGLLHCYEVVLYQRQVVSLPQDHDHAGVVNAGLKDLQAQQAGLAQPNSGSAAIEGQLTAACGSAV